MATRNARRQGFTLVELLVVMAIIGLLMGMLLPAVNSARETARRGACSSNLRNVALACLQYESTNKIYPLNWGSSASQFNNNDAAMGHSWITMILPQLDASTLYGFIKFGKPRNYQDPKPINSTYTYPNRVVSTAAIPILVCPSDVFDSSVGTSAAQFFLQGKLESDAVGVTNYKACLGMNYGAYPTSGNNKLIDASDPLIAKRRGRNASSTGLENTNGMFSRNLSSATNTVNISNGTNKIQVTTYGPKYPLTTAAGDIADGLSNTIMLGESVCLWSALSAWYSYDAPLSTCAYPINWDNNQARTEAQRRANSRSTGSNCLISRTFGSRHAGGANFAMADGHVQFVQESISLRVYYAMSTIDGREVMDLLGN